MTIVTALWVQLTLMSCTGKGWGGNPYFNWWAWSKDLGGGVEIFFARIFLGRKIWQVFCGWLVLSRQIHDFVTTVMASPGNHLVKNHESQSRTIWVPVQKRMSPSWVFCNPTPTLCITVYWNKNSSRNESRINIGWFPRQAPKFLVVWGHAPIGIFLDFNSSLVPFPGFPSHSERMLACSILLGWSICPIHFPDFNYLKHIYYEKSDRFP